MGYIDNKLITCNFTLIPYFNLPLNLDDDDDDDTDDYVFIYHFDIMQFRCQ